VKKERAESERPEKKRRRAASESEGGSERPKRSKASEGGAGTKQFWTTLEHGGVLFPPE
jgi:hypothetical protein